MLLKVDNREKEVQRKAVLKAFKETTVKCEVTTLSVCDYIVEDDNGGILFGIEWKSYDDFISSIGNGHLKSQLEDMDGMERSYLFIVGNYRQWIMKPTYTHVTRPMIAGFLTSAIARHNTKVCFYESRDEAIKEIIHLIKIHTEGETTTQFKLPERKVHTGNPQRDMYLSLPTVGSKKCDKYMEQLSFINFVNICKFDDKAKETMKNKYNLAVTDTLINFCKQL